MFAHIIGKREIASSRLRGDGDSYVGARILSQRTCQCGIVVQTVVYDEITWCRTSPHDENIIVRRVRINVDIVKMIFLIIPLFLPFYLFTLLLFYLFTFLPFYFFTFPTASSQPLSFFRN